MWLRTGLICFFETVVHLRMYHECSRTPNNTEAGKNDFFFLREGFVVFIQILLLTCRRELKFLLLLVHDKLGVGGDDVLLGVDAKDTEEGREDWLWADAHMFGEASAEGFGGLEQLVVGDDGEEVMDLVRANVVDDVVERPVRAVNGGQVSTDIVPLAVSIPGNIVVIVVEEGSDDQPRSKHKERHHVVRKHIDARNGDGIVGKERSHGAPGGKREEHTDTVATEEGLLCAKVVDGARPVTTDEVVEPAHAERKVSVLGEVHAAASVIADRVENLILVDVTGVLVVVTVGQLPRRVRCEDEGVHDRSNDIVHVAVLRETAVAAVVADHEDGPENGSLSEPVNGEQEAVVRQGTHGQEKTSSIHKVKNSILTRLCER